MCDKAVLENGGMLKSVPDCYKNAKMCNKAIDNCTYALQFVSNCYKTQKLWTKAVNTSPEIQFVSECYKTQEMCVKGYLRYKMCYLRHRITIFSFRREVFVFLTIP